MVANTLHIKGITARDQGGGRPGFFAITMQFSNGETFNCLANGGNMTKLFQSFDNARQMPLDFSPTDEYGLGAD